MTISNGLEKSGRLTDFNALDLLREVQQRELSGTFRFAQENKKIAVYLEAGKVIYAASNLRVHRLVIKLRQFNLLAAADVAMLESLPDAELSQQLLSAKKISAEALAMTNNRIVNEILNVALGWTTGEWQFTPLVRVREEMRVTVDLTAAMIAAARNLPTAALAKKFGTDDEESLIKSNSAPQLELQPLEAFVLSRLERAAKLSDLAAWCGLPVEMTWAAVYVLWLGALLERENRREAFDDEWRGQLERAKLTISASKPPASNSGVANVSPTAPETPLIGDEDNAVEIFLARMDAAVTHYEVLDVSETAETAVIKTAYMRMAKQFHPDKFHHLAGSPTHILLQQSFTRFTQAYDTLKDAKLREVYNLRLEKMRRGEEITRADNSTKTPAALLAEGVAAIASKDFALAVALIGRAVQFEPNQAEYRAQLGRAMSFSPEHRRQAEGQLQQAVRLDEKNAAYRLFLAQYYIENNLPKRAAAELNRILNQEPNHAGAQLLLRNLR